MVIWTVSVKDTRALIKKKKTARVSMAGTDHRYCNNKSLTGLLGEDTIDLAGLSVTSVHSTKKKGPGESVALFQYAAGT